MENGKLLKIYDTFKDKPLLTKPDKDGVTKTYRKVTISYNGESKYFNVFQGKLYDQMFKTEKLVEDDYVSFETETKGDYTNLVSCWRAKGKVEEVPTKADAYEKMNRNKMELGYKQLAWEMIEAAQKLFPQEYSSKQDFINQNVIEVSILAHRIENSNAKVEVEKMVEKAFEVKEETIEGD